MKRKLLFLAASISLLSTAAIAHATEPKACAAPDVATMSSVAEYVAAKDHAGSVHDLSLKNSSQANDDCFWKLEYEALSAHKSITLYLTPDHKYLVPAIYDRSMDPLAEERKVREESLRTLTAGHAASEGPKSATVTIVEFSDFQCPYCQRLTTMLEKEVLPAEPEVRVVFRNFPLSMHPWAQAAAQVAACAQMQNDASFWKMHDYIFNNQKELSIGNLQEKLVAVADADPALNHDAFHDCVNEALTMGPVSKDVELGKRFGVEATPTIFVNGTKIQGVRDAAQLKDLIEQAKAGKLVPTALEAPATQRASTATTRTAPNTACGTAN
jgi:protein-disulfide isomerase